jgi:DNA ligase (NAD+)
MTTRKSAVSIEELRDVIRQHDQKYYVDASPEISDLEYDRLMDQLKALEADNPDLVTADSPTQRVGESPVAHLEQVEHRMPMLSIDNTYSIEELEQFGDRTAGLLPDEALEWVVELKIDGVAATLIYEDGLLTRAVTRGNGVVGDDITHNVRTIADVPLRLLTDSPPAVLEVRGEVYMANDELVRLNEQQTANGEATYKNTRNVSAGAIRLLDPKICASRNLRMFCHGMGLCDGVAVDTYTEFLALIGQFGLPATPMAKGFPSFSAAVQYSERTIERLHELDFEVDGLVLKVNRLDQREQLGARSKSPRWLVAYKWEKYEAITKLNSITLQVGKTGAVTPVAEMEPVELAGTTVSRASLHNFDEIQRKDIRVGDTVVVEKAGKIIPHIVRVEKHERESGSLEFKTPTGCPECETALSRDDGGVYVRCTNPDCPAQIKEKLRYYATRNAMDIEGLGDKVVGQVYDAGLVRSIGDLYRLDVDGLLKLERMGKRSAVKLLGGIETSKSRGLERLLNALSIRHVGGRVAEILAQRFGDIDTMQRTPLEEFDEVDEIGGVIAQSVHDFLHSDAGSSLIEDLRSSGVSLVAATPTIAGEQDGSFSGLTFVVTGTLENYSRTEAQAAIKQHGGKTSSSVSAKTDYLLAGAKAGSKLAKAEKLGVKVLTEERFDQLLANDN